MPSRRILLLAAAALAAPRLGRAQPAPREALYTARNFRFSTGEMMPELRLNYLTLGDPAAPPVLILHGTGGTGRGMLNPAFGGELFGPGQPLDAGRNFIILPDAIGTGKSSKPSDGMGPRFPRYTYADMVRAQHLVVTEALGLPRLQLVLGNSMGGMHTWMWGTTYPDMMAAIVPMAAQPTPMAARNWMLRRMMIESIRRDPTYRDGHYTEQPASLRTASVFYGTATSGGTLAYQRLAPTTAQADAMVEQRLAASPPTDANDFIWQWESSRDYDPSPGLERIRAAVLAINAADDERNPPETGVTEAAMQRIARARLLLIPASPETSGHGTTGQARWWKEELRKFLAELG